MRGMAPVEAARALGDLMQLPPRPQPPFFFSQIGRTFLPKASGIIAWRFLPDALRM
jgi:hypothetical protein